ncbi:MAG: hypothetical protein O7J95_19985, partial [Planctomycetota bacterium]|nr:hypothetical protein [Planctomycetota bacterium]
MSDGLAVTPPRAPGEYVLEGEIAGRPGARWYRARRGERLVALRLFDADDAPESSTLERFLRDAPDRPRHPNLFVVEDVGRVGPDGEAGGALYYSTPTIGGDSLRQILEDLDEGRPRRPSFSPLAVGPEGDRHPGYVEHATGLIAEVAEGLDAA